MTNGCSKLKVLSVLQGSNESERLEEAVTVKRKQTEGNPNLNGISMMNLNSNKDIL